MQTPTQDFALAEKRLCKMEGTAKVMILCFAIGMLLLGGLLSIKSEWARPYDPGNVVIPASDTQYYVTSLVNLVSGLLYTITAIGLYGMADWGRKLNVISCAVYVIGTLVAEMVEVDKGNPVESFADVTFWSALPIIQLTLMLVAISQRAKISARPAAG